MITPFLILLIAICLFGLGGAATIWLFRRWKQALKSQAPPEATAAAPASPFRWRYVILPVVTLTLSIILVAFFYSQLPGELAYHFKPDGSPDRWLSRTVTMVWMLLPQVILTLIAGSVTVAIARMGFLNQPAGGRGVNLESILALMGNMIGLPQLVLCFAMLDIFSYNAYRTHLMPVWVFALIVVGLGTIILGLVFILAVGRARKTTRSPG